VLGSIRDTMSKVLPGFEDYNGRVRLPLGFRIRQPARELIFLTPSGKADFSTVTLPDTINPPGVLTLATQRSHDQWNTSGRRGRADGGSIAQGGRRGGGRRRLEHRLVERPGHDHPAG
jgi:hypothetical protein